MSKNSPMSGKERKARHAQGQRGIGRKRCEFWLTEKEYTELVVKLIELRRAHESLHRNTQAHTKGGSGAG